MCATHTYMKCHAHVEMGGPPKLGWRRGSPLQFGVLLCGFWPVQVHAPGSRQHPAARGSQLASVLGGPVLGVRGGSALIGVIEIAIGLAMATRQFAPAISAWGSLGAAFALLNTLSFLFTTPGLDPQSSDAGFLLKDLTLLGAALWSAAEANAAARARNEGLAGTPGFARTAEGDRANG